jgi:hypothetical protein
VSMHECGFCGRTFAEDDGQPTCASCPIKGGCQLVRCPHCGYENPLPPAWLTRVRSWFGTAAARQAGYDASGTYTGTDATATDSIIREAPCP